MKKMTLAMVLLIGVPTALFAEVSKEDVKKLCAAGISDNVILTYVRTNGPVVQLSADDVLELKQAGARDSLLTALLAAPSPASRPSPAYVPPPASADTYAPPSTTTVYSTTPSYSPSVVYEDYYPGAYYSGNYSSYCAPSFGLGYGYYGGQYCSGTYGNRYCSGYAYGPNVGNYRTTSAYSGSRVVGGTAGYNGHSAGGYGGGHAGFGGGHSGGGFGGGHAGGGGHR